ncbi:MAG: hypothetical protein LBC68_14555 [Prevotellaceae bacterium]|jgi:hypothetical protein|nr:hypothetical protein [Prevotellaceae bacterium]
MSLFNLYNEIKSEYENLIPAKQEGLVLFHLYQKQKDGDIGNAFSENEIINSLRETRYDLKTLQKEQFNKTIKYFQKYFLWRDEKNRLYRFKPFTKKWCKLIENILEETFNPTQLQKEFLYLSSTLNVKTFDEWYATTFESYSQRVDTQINALYIQIDRLVVDFRQQISNEHAYDLNALKTIVDTLDDIRSKTEELNNAFNGAHDIQSKLLNSKITTEDVLLNSKRADVLSFFQEIRGNLKIISKRIDSVRPRLNEYIRNINRRDFYMRFKRFFNYLLEKSIAEKGKIRFPDGIPNIPVRCTQQPRFIIVKEIFDGVSLSRFKTVKSKVPVTNDAETENRFLLEKERIDIQKRINLYLLDLESRLKAHQEVNFSDFFYEILKKENGNISVCVKLAHKTMSKYHKEINTFGVSISNETVGAPEYPMIKIWKTIIYRKM